MARGARVDRPPRSGHRAGHAGRGTCRLRRGGADNPVAIRPRAAQSGPARRCARRCPAPADAPGRGNAGGPEPRLPPDARRRGDGGARWVGRPCSRRPGARARLRRADEQRLACRQPVHGRREQARTAAGHRAVRQRPAARRHRAEEPRRRERHHLVRLPAASDLQSGDPVAVHVQRRARRVGRTGSAHRRADGRAGVVQAVAHDRGRGTGRPELAAAPGPARRRLQPAPAAGAGPRLHRVRGRWQRRPGQEDGRVPPVPCRADRRRRDAAGGSFAAVGRRPAGTLRVAPPAGRRPRRPADRRRLAHPGVGQEPDDGVLRRSHHARPGDGESHRRRADGPQRSRRPTVHHLLALRRPARAAAGPGREPRRPAGETRRRIGRRGVHDDPEVLPRRAGGRGARGNPSQETGGTRGSHPSQETAGRPAPAAVEPAQRRRDRRRGAPQPVRLHRRLRPPHARRAAQRLVHRLHRDAHRAGRRQHPRRVRRPHQRLRHPAGGRGRRDRADLLREPSGEGWLSTRPRNRRSMPASRR